MTFEVLAIYFEQCPITLDFLMNSHNYTEVTHFGEECHKTDTLLLTNHMEDTLY